MLALQSRTERMKPNGRQEKPLRANRHSAPYACAAGAGTIWQDTQRIRRTTYHRLLQNERRNKNDNIASTQSARQAKDATDLVVEPDRQYAQLIRRLTPLECERLQGFPDGWTNIPGASDSARYRALGNSVAIPCVEFIMKSLNEVVSLGM